MLLEDIVHGRESEHELLLLGGRRLEPDVKCMIRLLGDGLVHVTFESELLVGDGVESGSGGNLTLVFENYGQDGVFADSGLLELQHWGAVSVKRIGLLYLKSWEGALATQLEDKLAGWVFHVAAVNDGLEDSTVLHHRCGVEAHSDVLVLMRVNREAFRLHIKGKAFTLALGTGLHCKFDSARNLVGVDDLEAFLAAFWVL